jgi:4-amino-4-deoxy-L-arabinose transferase-like glycosyltransferase
MTTSTLPAARPTSNNDGTDRTDGIDSTDSASVRSSEPRWARRALLLLLGLTALLYIWDLGASGTANSFYAAAVQAGTKSWTAFFFGSLDRSNFITVDKPPASLWVMELSGRIFGFNAWSMLVPQALEGVAAVGLLYGAVRRMSGHVAGLIAGTLMALTPVAVLMFRFNNPDALLVLLMVAAAYAVVRAIESGRTTWLLLAGSALGFGFLTKMLQAFLVLPALGLVYLVCAPTPVRKRILQLLAAAAALVVSAGWWVLAVALVPAADRPYIGGSGNNTVLGLAFGYNGLSRITGGESGGNGTSFSGSAGITRLFATDMGAQISWLLPAALISLVAGLAISFRAPRTDRLRASMIIWGGWLVVTGVVFSYMEGTVHTYYTVALVPAIAALVATTGAALWQRRNAFLARATMATIVAATAAWSVVLLDRDPTWIPALRYVIVTAGAAAAIGLVIGTRRFKTATAVVVAAAVLGGLTGSTAYAVQTASTSHTGSTPNAGPAATGMGGGIGGGIGGGGSAGGGFGGSRPGTHTGAAPTGGTRPSGTPPTGTSTSGTSTTGTASTAAGAMGGGGTTTSTALTALLKATRTKWSAVVSGSQSAATLELASGTAVMAIGGFTGDDATPTLAQFEAYVKAGEVRYFIAGSSGGGGGTASTASAITTWVEAHYTATTVGGETVYDLSAAK